MKINPKNFFNRQLNYLPPHFLNVVISEDQDRGIEKIRRWVYQHCSGRFSITKDVKFEDGKTRPINLVGFEEPGDFTLFALSGLTQK